MFIKIGKIFLVLIGLIVSMVILLLVFISTPYFAANLGTWITHKSGRNVAMEGSIEMHLWSLQPQFIFRNVKIGNAEWSKKPTMFEVERLQVSVKLLPLFIGRVELPELIADKPKLNLEKNEKGDANWEFGENPQAAVIRQPLPNSRHSMPVIGRMQLTDGELSYHDPVQKISTELKTSSVNGESEKGDNIQLAGKGSYQGHPFNIKFSGASVLELRDTNQPYPFTLNTTIGATHASAVGTVKDPIKLEAMDVKLNLEGDNAADLFPILHIALPPTPHYKISGHLMRKGSEWEFENFAGTMGQSDLKGTIRWYPEKDKPLLEGRFVSDSLDMRDLAGFIGANKKPEDTGRVIPDTPLDISRLMAMDADVEFEGRHVKAPELLDDFLMHVVLKDGTLNLKPLSFAMAEGKISALITIEGKKTPPVVKGDVTFSHLSLNSIFEPLAKRFGKDNVQGGLFGGKFIFSGTGKSLREILANADGNLGLGMEGGQLSSLLLELSGLDILRSTGLLLGGDEPAPVHCVVTDFDLKEGIMTPQAFLIDTDVTSLTAEGTVSLRDETMGLKVLAHPKRPSLLSARSPIIITGSFKHPSIGVDTVSLVIRGGAATALGFIAPPAALLAFIEPGLGEKGQCAAVIRKLKADTEAEKQEQKKK